MNMQQPKVFISYSWSSADRVIELAERLMNNGVDVVLDKWELQEGQDKYAFMERSVTDETITKVLMICDKSYADKANNREGGVGDETMVISPEIYAKETETKYLPIIFERDEDGKEYIPTYLKSRIYFDLSNDEVFEEGYEKLLRNLFDKPERSKPSLGKMPEWLNEETVSLTPIRAAIKQIQALDGKNPKKLRHILKKFNDDFIETLLKYQPVCDEDFDDNILKQIDATKPLRDLFIDYTEALIINDYDVGEALGDFFEQVYNGVYQIPLVPGQSRTYTKIEFDFKFFLIWEMFIGATATLLYHNSYAELHSLLNRTFFLSDNAFSPNPRPCMFVSFYSYFEYLEERIRVKQQDGRPLTLAGQVVARREKLPILSRQMIANADLILYQLSVVFDIKPRSWFPKMYVYYYDSPQEIWSKMVSIRHCESLYPLFGVNNISELKEIISRNQPNHEIRYQGAARSAQVILNSIKLEDIAKLP